jgi:cytosine/adenosine deaminase-related metal-dependent hydrolase
MSSSNLLLQNILYLEGNSLELKRGNIAIIDGCVELNSHQGVEIDASEFIAIPGFFNAASENLVSPFYIESQITWEIG